MSVTVGSLEGLHEVVERFRTVGLRVAVSDVRMDQAKDVLAVLRHQVRTLHWRVDEGTMAALEAAADAFSRLETLGRMVDVVARDVREGLPITDLYLSSVVKAAGDVSRRSPPSLLAEFAFATLQAQDLTRVAWQLGRVPFAGDTLERQRSHFWESVDRARAHTAMLSGRTIPLPIRSITDMVSDLVLV